jgi:hypothetical protein
METFVMKCFSDGAYEIFERFGRRDVANIIEGNYLKLLDRRVGFVEYGKRSPTKPSQNNAKANCELLKQVTLHKAERLLAGSSAMLMQNNVYGIALLVRAHYETTSVLGHFCRRLNALNAGTLKLAEFEWGISDALMGARHSTFSEARQPPNTLTYVDNADKLLNKIIGEKKNVLRDSYDWLSEFCHPNFLSNTGAFHLDKDTGKFAIRHENSLTERDFDLFGYLSISAPIFIQFFDEFNDSLKKSALS